MKSYFPLVLSFVSLILGTHSVWLEDYNIFNKGTQSNVAILPSFAGRFGVVLRERWSDDSLNHFCAKFTVAQTKDGHYKIKAAGFYISARNSKRKWVDALPWAGKNEKWTITSVENNIYTIKSRHGWYLSTKGRKVRQRKSVTNDEMWFFTKAAPSIPSFLSGSQAFAEARNSQEDGLLGLLPSDWTPSKSK
mmetsp:Transcript_33397/g.37937  ORF Transcript_33397/g.37937 Transcript_33397/m.37937 type:complete len:192 (+) Transcript_33397:649-1224(+)